MSIVDDGRTDGRTTYDGRRLDAYTISSPCEPNGSGELIMFVFDWPSSFKTEKLTDRHQRMLIYVSLGELIKGDNFGIILIFINKIICCCYLLISPRLLINKSYGYL